MRMGKFDCHCSCGGWYTFAREGEVFLGETLTSSGGQTAIEATVIAGRLFSLHFSGRMLNQETVAEGGASKFRIVPAGRDGTCDSTDTPPPEFSGVHCTIEASNAMYCSGSPVL